MCVYDLLKGVGQTTLILWGKGDPGKLGLSSLVPYTRSYFCVPNKSLRLRWSFEQPNQHVSIWKLVGWAMMILGILL
jgi:hypothetical protein